MSLLVNFNNVGFGREDYAFGLDGSVIRAPKREPNFFSGFGGAFLDIPGAALFSASASSLEAFGAFLKSEPNEDESGFSLDDTLSSDQLMKAQELKKSAASKAEEQAKEYRRMVREDYTPSPETTGLAGQIVHGFGVMALKAGAYTLATGSPITGAMALGADYGVNEAGNLRDKGVDDATAEKAGWATGLATAGGMMIPGAFAKGALNPNRLSSAGWAGAANIAADSGEKVAVNYILRNAGYKDIASEYDAFDPVSMAVSGLFGGVVGAVAFKNRARVKPTPEPEKNTTQGMDEETLKSLQNRDRGTASSITQMRAIAANPDYGRLRASSLLTEGAPVITYAEDIPAIRRGYEDTASAADGTRYSVYYAVVEADDVFVSHDINGQSNKEFTDPNARGARAIAGNGRIAGLKEAYATGNAGKYKEEFAADAWNVGIPKDVVSQMEHPILVRVLDSGDVSRTLADKSNTSGISRMTLRERAKNDANRIDLSKLEFDEDGAVSEATVRGFISQLPAEERAELIDAHGKVNKTARDRVEAALFAKAYKNDSLISLVAETEDPAARSVLKTLRVLAPKIAELEGNELDISSSLVEAAGKIITGFKKGYKLRDIAAQREFGEDPIAASIVDLFAKDARTDRHVLEALNNLIEAIQNSSDNGSGALFGFEKLTREDLSKHLENFISQRFPTPSEHHVDAARAHQMSKTLNGDQPVSLERGNISESLINENRAVAQVDDGKRVSANGKAADPVVVAHEQEKISGVMRKVRKEVKDTPTSKGETVENPVPTNTSEQTPASQLLDALPDSIRQPVERVLDLFSPEEKEVESSAQVRDASLESRTQQALTDSPDMELTLFDETGNSQKVGAQELMDLFDKEAGEFENDAKGLGGAMACVLKNGGLE